MDSSDVGSALSRAGEETQRWLDENAEVFVCDFCAHAIKGRFITYTLDRPIEFTMSALDTETLEAASLDLDYSEEWGACLSCAPVVDAGDPVALAEHAVTNRDVFRVGPIEPAHLARVKAELVDLYREFYARDRQRKENER